MHVIFCRTCFFIVVRQKMHFISKQLNCLATIYKFPPALTFKMYFEVHFLCELVCAGDILLVFLVGVLWHVATEPVAGWHWQRAPPHQCLLAALSESVVWWPLSVSVVCVVCDGADHVLTISRINYYKSYFGDLNKNVKNTVPQLCTCRLSARLRSIK